MYDKAQSSRGGLAEAYKKPKRIVLLENSTICAVVVSIFAIGLSLVSIYCVLLIAFGILPALVAIVVDQEREKYISKIVTLYNTVGVATFLVKILRSGMPDAAAIDIIIDPHSWLIIFSSAAFGWVVYWIFPIFAIYIYSLKIDSRVKELELELKEIALEWSNGTTNLEKRG